MKEYKTTDIKALLQCSKCSSNKLIVGLTTNDELAIICEDCNLLVMLIDKWPNPELAKNHSYEVCDDCTCATPKEELN